MKTKIFYILIIVIYLITTIYLDACRSNVIYFDIEQQTIVGCEGAILNLYVESRDHLDYLHFSVLPNKKACRNFSFKDLNKNYSVTVSDGNFDLNNFRLRPETEYEITNISNGDASGGSVLVRTDQNGVVIYASKTSCK
jgi:hypothetical protein